MSCRTTTLLWLNLHIYKEFTIQDFFFRTQKPYFMLWQGKKKIKADKIKERANGLIYNGTS